MLTAPNHSDEDEKDKSLELRRGGGGSGEGGGGGRIVVSYRGEKYMGRQCERGCLEQGARSRID